MNKIKIGVLGYANIAKKAIIPTVLELPDYFDFVGVATRGASKSEEITAQTASAVYVGYHSLLHNNIIDAIYIPLPNALHFEYVKKALEKGIHVLVEKSLGCSYDEVSELVAIARENNLALVENFQFKRHSQLDFLIDKIKSKALGDIRSLNCYFGFPPFPDKDNIRYKKQLGGGALLDAGAYTTKITQLILGDDLKVTAAHLNSGPNQEVDIWGTAFVEQQTTGITAALAFGFDHHYQCGVQVWCSKGKISTNRLFTAPANYQPIYEIETAEGKQTIKLPPDHHFKNMLIHFFNCVNDDKLKELENQQNITQAKLLQSIKDKA